MAVLPSLPSFTISTTSTLPWSFDSYRQLAVGTGANGIDLDLTTWIGRVTLRNHVMKSLSEIRSVWLSGTDIESWNVLHQPDSAVFPLSRSVVIRLPAESMDDDLAIVRKAYRLKRAYAWLQSVTVAVPANALDGGRTHLTRLRLLCRFLEEWELGLGLELNRQTDSRWEAEAAILACADHLKTVRFCAPLNRVVDQKGDVLTRSLAALAEIEFSGALSLTPTAPIWLSWHRQSVIRDLEANRDAAARIFLKRKLALRQSYESHLRSTGSR